MILYITQKDFMKSNRDRIEQCLLVLRNSKIMTVSELMEVSTYSPRSLWAYLKEWGCYRSYNQNGRYYVLPDIPKFDQQGIWKFKNVYFSKHGNLKESIFHLVNQFPSGGNVNEVGAFLGISVHAHLTQYFKSGQIERGKYNGVYVYFSQNSAVYERQKKAREAMTYQESKVSLPSDYESVIILSQYAEHPEDTLETLVRRVRKKRCVVSVKEVRHLLIYHKLLKKTQV